MTEATDLSSQPALLDDMTGPASVGVSARDNDSGSSAGISTSTPRLLLPDTAENRFKLSESPIWCGPRLQLHGQHSRANQVVCLEA